MGGVEMEHIFCDNDTFCQQVLKKHWPKSKIYGDIRKLTKKKVIADTYGGRHERPDILRRKQYSTARNNGSIAHTQGRKSGKQAEQKGRENIGGRDFKVDILTGGFPCQPFSQAGLRKGKEDDRYLWPEMLKIIRTFKPTWIVGENVAGILTMAQQQNDTDLESQDLDDGDSNEEPRANGIIWGIINDLEQAGYSVQTFVIPACAVGAPHRRDRVWIVAYADSDEYRGWGRQIRKAEKISGVNRPALRSGRIGGTIKNGTDNAKNTGSFSPGQSKQGRDEQGTSNKFIRPITPFSSNSFSNGLQRSGNKYHGKGQNRLYGGQKYGWDANWLEVATELCGVDDGLPVELDGFKLTKAANRTQRLKALGNSIVPQVATEIFRAIKQISDGT